MTGSHAAATGGYGPTAQGSETAGGGSGASRTSCTSERNGCVGDPRTCDYADCDSP